MSGWWIKLGDTQVRCDRPDYGDRDSPWSMANCLANLFDVGSAPIDQDEDNDYGQGFVSDRRGVDVLAGCG